MDGWMDWMDVGCAKETNIDIIIYWQQRHPQHQQQHKQRHPQHLLPSITVHRRERTDEEHGKYIGKNCPSGFLESLHSQSHATTLNQHHRRRGEKDPSVARANRKA
jgi:hypothetical protein